MSQFKLYNLSERDIDAIKTVLATRPEDICQFKNNEIENSITQLFPSEKTDWVCNANLDWLDSAYSINVCAAKDIDGQVYLWQQNNNGNQVFMFQENINDVHISEAAIAKFEDEIESYKNLADTPHWIAMIQYQEYHVLGDFNQHLPHQETTAPSPMSFVSASELKSNPDTVFATPEARKAAVMAVASGETDIESALANALSKHQDLISSVKDDFFGVEAGTETVDLDDNFEDSTSEQEHYRQNMKYEDKDGNDISFDDISFDD